MIKPWKLALGFAVLLGGWHLVWAAFVAVGWGQPVLDFIFRLHFLTPILIVTPFAVGPAVALVALTAAIGAVLGWLVGVIWNCAAG